MTQNDKKFCLLHPISQEPFIIWFSFMMHICKMIISAGFYFIFSKFWFFGLFNGINSKKWSKMTKNSVHCALYVKNHTSCDCHFWYTSIKQWYLQVFFYFSKILIFQVVRGLQVFFSVCHISYLMSHNRHLLDASGKWWYFQVVFFVFVFIFSKFWFFLVSGVKGQKVSQNYKKCLSFALHFSGTTHMIFTYGTQV